MSWADLIRPVTKPARKAAVGIGLERRIRIALEQPPPVTVYVSPTLRRLEAVLFAARGYYVHWAPVSFEEGPDTSVLAYVTVIPDGRLVEVELPTVIPGRAHALVADLKNTLIRTIARI